MQGGFSKAYNEHGVDKFYEQSADNYSNPHKYDIERLIKKKLGKGNVYLQVKASILDLACGNGQATLPLQALGYKHIIGADPFTFKKYEQLTGCTCLQHNFLDILNGALDEKHFNVIVCSYALHLVKESMLHNFCNKLADLSQLLIVISPHKFPQIKPVYGWKEIEHYVQDRIHFRVYKSLADHE